jgi:hypothetical protein
MAAGRRKYLKFRKMPAEDARPWRNAKLQRVIYRALREHRQYIVSLSVHKCIAL